MDTTAIALGLPGFVVLAGAEYGGELELHRDDGVDHGLSALRRGRDAARPTASVGAGPARRRPAGAAGVVQAGVAVR